MSDDFPTPTYVDSTAGGHVTVAKHKDSTITLMTSKGNGHPGPLRLTADEARRIIAELRRAVAA